LAIAHSQRLAHVVGVNGFFTALAAYARQQRTEGARLATWWSERRSADRWGRIVRPDGYGRWEEHGREVDFFLEYDRGTETTDRLAAKLLAYQELADATRIPTPVLLWLPSLGREATVRQALATTGRRSHDHARVVFVVATATAVVGPNPAEAAWLTLDRTWPRRRLIELADVDPKDWTPETAGADGP
jgi:hypothetical protein